MRNRVGVIIPTYERPVLTIRAAESAINQTVRPERILVVDDGSSNGARDVLEKELADLGVEYLWLKHSGHPGVARKKGVETVDTEWIAFLDSDDEWIPQKIELQLNALQISGNRAICSNAKLRSNSCSYFSNRDSERVINRNNLLKSNFVICSSAMVERKVLMQIGIFADEFDVLGAEDFATWLRVSMLTDWDYIDEPLVNYTDLSEDSLRVAVNRLEKSTHLLGLKNYSKWSCTKIDVYLLAALTKAHIFQMFGR